MSFAKDVQAFLEDHPDTKTVEVLFTDINGILRGKQCPVATLPILGDTGITIAATTLLLDAKGAVSPAHLGFHGDPDVRFRAVPGTLATVPWSAVPTAQVLTSASALDGTRLHFDPRAVLAKAVEPLVAMGLTPVVALEAEFYLLKSEATAEPATPIGGLPALSGPQCLTMEMFWDFEPFIRDVEALAAAQNVPLGSILVEYGETQFEANLRHEADPLAACDHLVVLKRLVKAAARKRGVFASFMAKPLGYTTGSGLHVHLSLVDGEGRNVLAAEGGRMLQHAVGGVLKALPESIALLCPNANSYRRLQPESFVPLRASWGPNHRSVAVRVPHSGEKDRRLEHRVAGADACPYLVTAAVLAGVHHGIAGRIEPPPMTGEGEPVSEGEPFPTRWPTALEAFARGTILPRYLGDDFCATYLAAKREEEARYNAEVSANDLEWYLRVV